MKSFLILMKFMIMSLIMMGMGGVRGMNNAAYGTSSSSFGTPVQNSQLERMYAGGVGGASGMPQYGATPTRNTMDWYGTTTPQAPMYYGTTPQFFGTTPETPLYGTTPEKRGSYHHEMAGGMYLGSPPRSRHSSYGGGLYGQGPISPPHTPSAGGASAPPPPPPTQALGQPVGQQSVGQGSVVQTPVQRPVQVPAAGVMTPVMNEDVDVFHMEMPVVESPQRKDKGKKKAVKKEETMETMPINTMNTMNTMNTVATMNPMSVQIQNTAAQGPTQVTPQVSYHHYAASFPTMQSASPAPCMIPVMPLTPVTPVTPVSYASFSQVPMLETWKMLSEEEERVYGLDPHQNNIASIASIQQRSYDQLVELFQLDGKGLTLATSRSKTELRRWRREDPRRMKGFLHFFTLIGSSSTIQFLLQEMKVNPFERDMYGRKASVYSRYPHITHTLHQYEQQVVQQLFTHIPHFLQPGTPTPADQLALFCLQHFVPGIDIDGLPLLHYVLAQKSEEECPHCFRMLLDFGLNPRVRDTLDRDLIQFLSLLSEDKRSRYFPILFHYLYINTPYKSG